MSAQKAEMVFKALRKNEADLNYKIDSFRFAVTRKPRSRWSFVDDAVVSVNASTRNPDTVIMELL